MAKRKKEKKEVEVVSVSFISFSSFFPTRSGQIRNTAVRRDVPLLPSGQCQETSYPGGTAEHRQTRTQTEAPRGRLSIRRGCSTWVFPLCLSPLTFFRSCFASNQPTNLQTFFSLFSPRRYESIQRRRRDRRSGLQLRQQVAVRGIRRQQAIRGTRRVREAVLRHFARRRQNGHQLGQDLRAELAAELVADFARFGLEAVRGFPHASELTNLPTTEAKVRRRHA